MPVDQAQAPVATNQRDGQMEYTVDHGEGTNPHVNYEPSIHGGLREAQYPHHDEQGPEIHGRLTRKRIPLTQDYLQAGQRYLLLDDWERDDLVGNFVTLLGQCERDVQERMVWHFFLVEDELGEQVGDGLGIKASDVSHLEPLASQTLSEQDEQRRANLGTNGRRSVEGLTMTHCVPDERLVTTR